METQAAADFVAAVFAALNRRDYVKASQYFAADVTITGAEFGVLKGPDAVIGHFHQSDAALSDSQLEVVDVLTGERGGQTKVGVELVLTGTHTAAFELGAAGPTVARTGRHVAIPVFWVMTVNNGKITKVAHYWDMFRVLTGLGAAATGAGSV